MLSSRDVPLDSRRALRLARTRTADIDVQPCSISRQDSTSQAVVVLALLAVVIALDQVVKWWAWRHVPGARINAGGDALVGRTIGAWYARPVTGALFDVLDFGLLSVVVWLLARYRASAAVFVPGALMTGGWVSNLLDRLGLHYWTAPGSVRGVVDFIHLGVHYYNLADFFIIGCTPLFLLAAGYHAVRAARRPGTAGSLPSAARFPARARIPARARVPVLLGAVLISVVTLGAAHYGGVNAPPRAGARDNGPACAIEAC
jgi:lipoprotein signal peptidase